jgi:hypothetical protein
LAPLEHEANSRPSTVAVTDRDAFDLIVTSPVPFNRWSYAADQRNDSTQ